MEEGKDLARQPNASPLEYQSPAPGDSVPIPGLPDHLGTEPSYGTVPPTLYHAPCLFSAAISHSQPH